MKLMIASDLHGSATACEKMLSVYKKSGAGKLLLLGDLLYHGPRNDLPQGYDPKSVIKQLGEVASDVLCVRGNCDSEVDGMVLPFPISADFMPIFVDGLTILATHGHLNIPTSGYDAVLSGHTHIWGAKWEESILFLNPGSVSLPKGGNVPTYMIYENGAFSVFDFDGNELFREVIQWITDR